MAHVTQLTEPKMWKFYLLSANLLDTRNKYITFSWLNRSKFIVGSEIDFLSLHFVLLSGQKAIIIIHAGLHKFTLI